MGDARDSLPLGLLVFSDDGGIVSVNRTLGEWLGRAPEELLGRQIDVILTVASRIFYQTHLFPLVKLHGKADEISMSLRTAHGEDLPVLLNAVRKEHEGTFENECAIMIVRERRKLEQEILLAKRAAENALESNEELVRTKRELEGYSQELDRKLAGLERKNQELARVSQILSHDLREPVRKISWFADILLEEAGGGLAATATTWIEKIVAESRRADHLLHLLREFVSLDLEEEPRQTVDLHTAVTTSLLEIQGRGATIDLELPGTLPMVTGSPAQLALLFRLLIEHALALKAGPDGIRIRISGSLVEENSYRVMRGKYKYEPFARVLFIISGAQPTARMQDEVFDPLATLGRKDRATGFGLATCGKIVGNHHGSITVRSECSGDQIVTILLPLTG